MLGFRASAICASIMVWAAALAAAPRTLDVTVLGSRTDPRMAAVEEAVAFWNRELEAVGARVRLGPVHAVDAAISESVLRELSRRVVRGWGGDLPEEADRVSGDVVVALSDADMVSFAMPLTRWSKGFVALRRADIPPLSLPNVARNAVAHELGHVLGLEHNDDPATLMCGRPAPCRPGDFESDSVRFFPLTRDDEEDLRDRWR